MPEDAFRIERDGHVATLFLADPDRRNAMGPAFWDGLPRHMADLGADPEIRTVVIAADGPAFSVGLDLKSMAGEIAGGDAGSVAAQKLHMRELVLRLQASITAVADCPKPVVAAVHGWVIGGAIDLITACDIRVAARDAVFSVRETRMAMTADVGTLQRLPGIIGRGHVAELALTGRDIDAARAERIGLVNDVYESREATVDAAQALAAEIAANSPLAVFGVKEMLMAPLREEWDRGLRYVATWNAAFLPSDDLGEALAAFVEKRPPRFTGD
ncbi:MAG: crotonase/enoyl-CoA hydratase family protein [Acidimicrobiia bacterium]|nr:crotonase/enoyl-CoA hydratase family protein [Acidimicrobiia bacterium]